MRKRRGGRGRGKGGGMQRKEIHSAAFICYSISCPYSAPDPPCRDIAAAWAGGVDGREVIDRVLPLIPQLLSKPAGLGFMVLVKVRREGGKGGRKGWASPL